MKGQDYDEEAIALSISPASRYDKSLPAIEQAVRRTEELFLRIRLKGEVPILEIRSDILPLIHSAAEQELFPLLLSLQAKDDYLYRHPVAVSVISTLLGQWMDLPENELAMLTVGAHLHNVGIMRLPEAILTKEGPLDPEEFDLIKKHPLIGYELLEQTVGVSKRSALIALQHHERIDGTGYPLRLTGEQTDLLSRIVAVADAFHALTCNRSYRNAASYGEILHQMYFGTIGKFDFNVLRTFMTRLMNAMIGCEVALSDNRRGKIIMIHPSNPAEPLVQIEHEFVDLSRERAVNMALIIG